MSVRVKKKLGWPIGFACLAAGGCWEFDSRVVPRSSAPDVAVLSGGLEVQVNGTQFEIAQVDYSILRATDIIKHGSLDVAGPGQTFSGRVDQLAPFDAYHLELRAEGKAPGTTQAVVCRGEA